MLLRKMCDAKFCARNSIFLDKSWQVWAANRRPPKADQRATSTSSRPARVRRPPASSEERRQMRLRTPAIRRDRPTVQGSPALRARSMAAGLAPAELPAKNHRCDAKDHARPPKYLEQNTSSKRDVQVRPGWLGAGQLNIKFSGVDQRRTCGLSVEISRAYARV